MDTHHKEFEDKLCEVNKFEAAVTVSSKYFYDSRDIPATAERRAAVQKAVDLYQAGDIVPLAKSS